VLDTQRQTANEKLSNICGFAEKSQIRLMQLSMTDKT